MADAIYRHCYFRLPNSDIAQDITQKTFEKTWQYLVEGKEIKNTKPFLYKIANNLIIDEYRRKKPVSLDDLMEQDTFLEENLNLSSNDHEKTISALEAKDAVKTLNQLGGAYKSIVAMRYIEDLSVKEISEITGERENTVSVKIHRGLNKLKELIDTK